MSLRKTAASGSRLETLEKLRDVLAAAIDGCESLRDLAALTNRFQSVLMEIQELAPEQEQKGDAVDEIARRRAARRAGATADSARSTRSG